MWSFETRWDGTSRGWVERSETHPTWRRYSPPLQPCPQPFHRFADVRGGARIAEADEASPMHRIEIGARGRGDARLFQHAAGEIEAVVTKARHIGVEIEGAVDRQEVVESGTRQALHENA